jgi:hypothetical protein
MMVRGERKDVRARNGVGGPNNLACGEVPPHIRVFKARSHREKSEHGKKSRDRYREGKDSLENPQTFSVDCQRGTRAQAVPIS